MGFLRVASGSTCSRCGSFWHSLAGLWGLGDGLFGWKMELLPCGEGVGNVVLIRSCLVLAAQQQVELGLAAPELGLDVHGAGTGCEIAACGKLTFLSSSQLLFLEFLQHIMAFLIQLIPRSSELCCCSAQAVVGQSQPGAHSRSHGAAPGTPWSHQGIPCASSGSLSCPHIPEHIPRARRWHSWQVGQAEQVCFWRDPSQKCWGVVFPTCHWFPWVLQLWELLLVFSLPEETILAAELHRQARRGLNSSKI